MGKPSCVAGTSESTDTFTIHVKKPDLRYLNAFIDLKCAPDLLELKMFPNAKEITESMAMYAAVAKLLPKRGEDLGSELHKVFVIGDGSTPRTAAIFAFRSRWQCFSIDPLLKEASRFMRVNRLHLFPCKVQELGEERRIQEAVGREGYNIVVLPHAHVGLDDVAAIIPNPDFIVAMPCCNPHAKNQELWHGAWGYDYSYADWGIHSPHRTIRVWDFVRGE